MKRAKPRQHKRKYKSGKTTIVNKGVKKKKTRNQGAYKVFKRKWWKPNPSWPEGKEPGPGRKTTLATYADEDQARDHAMTYNRLHDPGKYSMKAEYEEVPDKKSRRNRGAQVSDKWLAEQIDDFVPKAMSEEGAEKVKRVIKEFDYNKEQAKEVIDDALWYNDEDFWRINHKPTYKDMKKNKGSSFKNLSRKEKDEVIKAMKNPNKQEAFMSEKGDPDSPAIKRKKTKKKGMSEELDFEDNAVFDPDSGDWMGY